MVDFLLGRKVFLPSRGEKLREKPLYPGEMAENREIMEKLSDAFIFGCGEITKGQS